MMYPFLIGVATSFATIGIIAVIFGAILIVKKMIANDIIFTTVQEGQAKIVLRFGQLDRAIMAYSGHRFKGGEGYDAWEVIPDESEGRPFWGGLRIVGIPFVHTIQKQRFNWTSLEQQATDDGGTKDELVTSEDENMAHVLLQGDVYVSEIKEAETLELVPVDVILLLTIRITNPAKARCNINHWLEATHNQIRPVARAYFGTQQFSNLISIGANEKTIEELLGVGQDGQGHTGVALEIKEQFGVFIAKVQVHKIDQSPIEGVNLVELATKKYAAEREREATLVDADAEAKRIDLVYGKIKSFGALGQSIVALETLAKTGSNIFVGTEGGGLSKALIIGDTTKEKGGE